MISGVPLKTCWAFNKLWNYKFYHKLHLAGIPTEPNNFHFIIQPTQMWCSWIVQILLSDLQCKYHTLPSKSLDNTKTSSMGTSLASSPKACYIRLHPNTAAIWSKQTERWWFKGTLWERQTDTLESGVSSRNIICHKHLHDPQSL
jgi:hypothetical protein